MLCSFLLCNNESATHTHRSPPFWTSFPPGPHRALSRVPGAISYVTFFRSTYQSFSLWFSSFVSILYTVSTVYIYCPNLPIPPTLLSRLLKVKALVSQSSPTARDPMYCSPPGSSVHGILQARILEAGWALLPGIFPTQGLNPGLLRCR